MQIVAYKQKRCATHWTAHLFINEYVRLLLHFIEQNLLRFIPEFKTAPNWCRIANRKPQ